MVVLIVNNWNEKRIEQFINKFSYKECTLISDGWREYVFLKKEEFIMYFNNITEEEVGYHNIIKKNITGIKVTSNRVENISNEL